MSVPPRKQSVSRAKLVQTVSIGAAARLACMHPQTIRDYERRGLIAPLRTDGGTRRYREHDIQQLRRIQQLTELGMSLSGVAMVLRLEQEVDSLRATVRTLEQQLLQSDGRHNAAAHAGAAGTQGSAELQPRRTISLEVVHVPRPRRRPRWTNAD